MSLRNVVILSCCQGDSDLDQVQHLIGGSALRKLGGNPIEAEGVYKGTSEKSWVVPLTDRRLVVAVTMVALRYRQESVLAVDSEGNAALVYLSYEQDKEPTVVPIGKLVEVSEEEALGLDHTKADGKFYVVRNDDEHVLH